MLLWKGVSAGMDAFQQGCNQGWSKGRGKTEAPTVGCGMSMNMSHLTMSKRSNKPVGTIPTYGVPSASFMMIGGILRGCRFTTPLVVPQYNCVTLSFPFPTFIERGMAGQQPVVRVSRCFTATRSNRLLVKPSSMTDGNEPTEHPFSIQCLTPKLQFNEH